MLFAAGLGTRLRPLTNHKPKALVEIGGVSLLERNLRNLYHQGCKEVVVNVHYFADLVEDFIDSHIVAKQPGWTVGRLADDSPPMPQEGMQILISDERAALLETGGGLLKAKSRFENESFLVHNVDILSSTDLKALMHRHQEKQNLATLCVRQRATSRYLLFAGEALRLYGWENVRTGERKLPLPLEGQAAIRGAFSGIYVCHPRIFTFMPAVPSKFSIIETLLAAAAKEQILAYPHDDDNWVDVGRPAAIPVAERLFT